MGGTKQLFDRFVAERREAAVPGYDLHALPHLTRYSSRTPGGEGFALFARLPEGDNAAAIRETTALFEALGQDFEWKVYDYDGPSDLKRQLEAAGFRAHHDEVFMVAPVDRPDEPARAGAGIRIEQAAPGNGVVDDAVAVQESAWSTDFPALRAQLRDALATGESAIFCAYRDDRPVGCGWIDYVPGSSFADLHGGAVIEQARGQGAYSRLLQARVRHAREKGCRYLTVDAAPMSRPILEKKGFMRVCATYPMRLKPYGIAR